MTLMTEKVTLRFEGGPTGDYDAFGNPILEDAHDEEWAAWYEPRTSGENVQAQDQQTSGYWVYLPLAAPLTSADAVVIAGVEYEVKGEPGRQPGGFITEGYQLAGVERTTG